MKSNSPQVTIAENKKEAAKKAAEVIKSVLDKKPNSVLFIASGETMMPVYKEVSNLYRKKLISFKNATVFSLDEYLGIEKNDKNSFRSYYQKNLISKVDLQEKNINLFNSETKNPKEECLNYENKIKSLGKPDLAVLGLGINGHIAFNEPGTSANSKTRVISLSRNTIKYNSRFFNPRKKVPEKALTVGVSTILNAKKILLIATGKHKKTAVKKTLYSKISKEWPSTFLKKHKNVVLVFDKDAFT
jgi:glucosamine-6-phosphate deaminase